MITAEITGVEETQDELKNIIIWISFKQDDGAEIPFYRGATLLQKNGKKVWPLYSRYENFLGKTPEMILKWIQINVESQMGNIIKELKAKSVLNSEMIASLNKTVGSRFQIESVTLPIDPDCSGIDSGSVELKDDGTYTVK